MSAREEIGNCADNDVMKPIILPVLLVLCAAVQAETNYCRDSETNRTWDEIKQHHWGDRDIESLAALRERLCREVAKSMLSVPEASERFEAERERVVKHRREYNRRWDAASSGIGRTRVRA